MNGAATAIEHKLTAKAIAIATGLSLSAGVGAVICWQTIDDRQWRWVAVVSVLVVGLVAAGTVLFRPLHVAARNDSAAQVFAAWIALASSAATLVLGGAAATLVYRGTQESLDGIETQLTAQAQINRTDFVREKCLGVFEEFTRSSTRLLAQHSYVKAVFQEFEEGRANRFKRVVKAAGADRELYGVFSDSFIVLQLLTSGPVEDAAVEIRNRHTEIRNALLVNIGLKPTPQVLESDGYLPPPPNERAKDAIQQLKTATTTFLAEAGSAVDDAATPCTAAE